jgi:hypothetical protein
VVQTPPTDLTKACERHAIGPRNPYHIATYCALSLLNREAIAMSTKYPISRKEAIRRLRHRWLAQTAAHPDIEPIFPLSHFLRWDTIRAVQRFNLYAYYSTPRHLVDPEARRRHAILRAWMASRRRTVRQ